MRPRRHGALLCGPSTSPLERSMHRRSFIAVGVGVAVLWLTQWAKPHLMESLLPAPTQNFPLLPAVAMDVFLPVVQLLPGFCAGVISGRRGILLGALTGFIGSATYSALFILFRLHFSHLDHFFTSVGAPMWFQIFGLGLTISCAAGGAVGELLRSNNRWRGP